MGGASSFALDAALSFVFAAIFFTHPPPPRLRCVQRRETFGMMPLDQTTTLIPTVQLKPNADNQNMVYQLAGAVVYIPFGNSNPANGDWIGHYEAVVACDGDGKTWRTISDSTVNACGRMDVRASTHARLLLYNLVSI